MTGRLRKKVKISTLSSPGAQRNRTFPGKRARSQTRARCYRPWCSRAIFPLRNYAPRNIIDKAAQAPDDVPPTEWTYRRRFLVCWEALRIEYQPSTSVDLKQLREQIYKLTDEGPGGFENFRSEFHRLHTEITATGVVEAITNRKLNEIVRDGIKNQFVWVNVCYSIYKDNPNSPWQATLEAVSTALTSYRQKGFDPYAEAKSEPVINAKSISANAVFTTPNRGQQGANKKNFRPPRDASGKFQKSFRPSGSAPPTAPNANDRGPGNPEAQQSD